MQASEHPLAKYGWNEHFAAAFRERAEPGWVPGRVLFEDNLGYRLATEAGERGAIVAGRLRYEAASRVDLPAVGDWVGATLSAADRAVIQAVLPRRSSFTRKVAGSRSEAQIVGANIDTVFLLTSLNQDFNPRRIERYLTLAWESGASPVIVLTKADLCPDVDAMVGEAEQAARGVPVHAVSVRSGVGLGELEVYLRAGETLALLGSSGVGKSTLINHWLGFKRQRVREVRMHDDRGQHATRHREMILLPGGALVIDTPGMRELQLWDAAEGIELAFEDVEALAAECRFSDCRHESEPRCAVREALDEGRLARARFESYLKLRSELESFRARHDEFARRQIRQHWKRLTREAKARARSKRDGSGEGKKGGA